MGSVVSMFERELACTRCGELVLVTELPERFIEPAEYVCGRCAGSEPRAPKHEQLRVGP